MHRKEDRQQTQRTIIKGPRNAFTIKTDTMWNKIHWKLRKDKPNYFDGVRIPAEVLELFFVYTDPLIIKKYRLICRSVNQAVTSAAFARLNWKCIDPQTTTVHNYTSEWLEWLPFHQIEFAKSMVAQSIKTIDNHSLPKRSHKLLYTIPASIGYLTQLVTLELGEWFGRKINFQGPIPVEFGLLENLTVLKICKHGSNSDGSGDRDGGRIPVELGNLAKLELLRLSWCQLSGPIPHQLSNLERLETLDLGHNFLEGPIPAELNGLHRLVGLDLSGNKLVGPIPELNGLTRLVELDLSFNPFKCEFPLFVVRLRHIQKVNMEYSRLVGYIPQALDNLCSSLTYLHLHENNFEGTFDLAKFPHFCDVRMDTVNESSGSRIWREDKEEKKRIKKKEKEEEEREEDRLFWIRYNSYE
ncbi:hypothetical protein BDR26DRAFT_852692 [Obelidium mucronatum]|nr:hypothetical protein BDR26DRAFT_852692 [Obelidium mucronatum]